MKRAFIFIMLILLLTFTSCSVQNKNEKMCFSEWNLVEVFNNDDNGTYTKVLEHRFTKEIKYVLQIRKDTNQNKYC